jgi:hypothetical protein
VLVKKVRKRTCAGNQRMQAQEEDQQANEEQVPGAVRGDA